MLARALPVLLLLSWLLWSGYQRRRGIWTSRSWRRFGGMLGASVLLEGVGLAMAAGVDNGVYDGMSAAAHQAYFYTLMGLALLSPLAMTALILWFAWGSPERQLG